MNQKKNPEKVVREIKRKTRRKFTAEEKIRIILEGLRGEESIAAICRRESIHVNLYYNWSKSILEAGKKRLMGDITREATSDEVGNLKRENERLKILLAEMMLENSNIKKAWLNLSSITIRRYHESLYNLTPADVFFGRDHQIQNQRKEIKYRTIRQRRINYLNRKLELTQENNKEIA